MRVGGSSIGCSHPRTCSGKKTLRRCRNNEEVDNVILIDVESDNFNNVVIIDVPEPVPQKPRDSCVHREGKSDASRTVICIDDDEADDDNHSGVDAQGSGSSDSSLSTSSCPSSTDSCQFVQETTSPLKLSKCKRTYSEKAYSRNHYGLGPESVSASDDDFTDCIFMEDSFGKLKEQWEKASSKRKNNIHNAQSCKGDQASASKFYTDIHHNMETESMTQQQKNDATSSRSGNAGNEEEIAPCDGTFGSTSYNPEKTPFGDIGQKSTEKSQSFNSEVDVQDKEETFAADPSLESFQWNHVEHDFTSFCNYHVDEEETPLAESSLFNSDSPVDKNNSTSEASFSDEDVISCENQSLPETFVECDRVVSGDEFKKFQPATSCNSRYQERSSFVDHDMLVSGASSFHKSKPSGATLYNDTVAPDEVGAGPDEIFCELGVSSKKTYCQESKKPIPEEPCSGPIPCKDTKSNNGEPLLEVKEVYSEPTANCERLDVRDNGLHLQDSDDKHSDQDCIINEREKLKETDEYKRVVEEEWASRQRQLQIQAEEAQKLRRLRKRERAESMRLLDMERRQKQRVEEMRETQKKDEENMNLKEQYRAEVRKELNQLEITCRDMASLLRGLGITVDGGLTPSPHEVRGAYKRALLSFHPDRASGSDVRQLVEAEEKFKLISRMREKYKSTF